MQRLFARTLDATLILCALAMTAFSTARFLSSRTRSEGGAMHRISEWQRDLAFDRRIGSQSAPYRIVVWTDYQCPACKRLEGEIARLQFMLDDSLAVVYRYFPLDGHPLAYPAAILAECARQNDRFSEMHHALFAATLVGQALPIGSLAQASSIQDTLGLARCTHDPAVRRIVERDISRGRELGIAGTPALQIGSKLGVGGSPAEELLPLIRATRSDVVAADRSLK